MLIDAHTTLDADVFDMIYTVTLAYGMCSFTKQIELLKQRYQNEPSQTPHIKSMETFQALRLSNPGNMPIGINVVEPAGVRIGETTNDGIALVFIKEVFSNLNIDIDGIVSPRMFSPYFYKNQDMMMVSEIVIFDPKKSGIKLLNVDPNVHIQSVPISNFIQGNNKLVSFYYKNTLRSDIYLHEGGELRNSVKRKSSRHKLNFFDKLVAQHPKTKQQYTKAVDVAKRFVTEHQSCKVDATRTYAHTVTACVTPWRVTQGFGNPKKSPLPYDI
jgi:hypothetical protein